MKIYLISNNLVLEDIIYKSDETLEQKRINRPLSIEGEKIAKKLGSTLDVQLLFSSDYASALGTAKYISAEKNIPIHIDSNLRDAKIGELGNKNIKTLRIMQDKDFNYKFINGESLKETALRIKKVISDIVENNEKVDMAIFTHKRAILSYLLEYTEQGFNLDDRLILTFEENVILDDSDKDINIVEIEINDTKIVNIKTIEL